MKKSRKSRAYSSGYLSPRQLELEGFESPFERSLNPENRWVRLSKLIPWDEICSIYEKRVGKYTTGRPGVNARIVIGSLIIKYLCNLDDRETVEQIEENVYMQYFLGYRGFLTDKPFDASLFVDFRKILGLETINEINEKIVQLKTKFEDANINESDDSSSGTCGGTENTDNAVIVEQNPEEETSMETIDHKGKLIVDATCCPQDIAYPTDLRLLSDAREKSEELIDFLYDTVLHGAKPRTYRKIARKKYLQVAQKKVRHKKAVRKAIRQQLGYLGRNIGHINRLLDAYDKIPWDKYQLKYFYVIQTIYNQQFEMFTRHTHMIEYRIVSIHQPHVRPIVRGKERAKVEFGAKINVSLIEGICFIDELDWEAFNEGSRLEEQVEKYRKRFGFYPGAVLADRIYCTRANRAMLMRKGIKLHAKPLGRPSALSIHVSPGERNPIESKFGQGKTAYGLNRIRARLKDTSESWIAGIFMVLNLVKLAGSILPCAITKLFCRFNDSMTGKIRLCIHIIKYHLAHAQIRCA